MKTLKFVFTFCAVIVLGSYFSGCTCEPDELTASQSVTLMSQQTNNWCWAAVTQMITTFFTHGRNQCDLANQRFGRTDCCTPSSCPKTDSCNRPGWTMFDECNFNSRYRNTPLEWDTIKTQIFCKKKPMAYMYGPSVGVGHVVCIYGYAKIGETRYLFIKDPWSPCTGQTRTITYEDYMGSSYWGTELDITYRN